MFAQWTVAWVRPVDDHGTIKADVPDEDVVTYADPDRSAVYFDEDGNPVGDPPTDVAWDYTLDPANDYGADRCRT